jgi:hypothetical protein
VIGGHAVAGHGEPRLTEDLDVFVDRSAENAKRRSCLFPHGAHARDLLRYRVRADWISGRDDRCLRGALFALLAELED